MQAFLRSFGDDLGHAARKLRRSPGFTLTAIALLGAAIGASTALFSLFNALLLRPIDAVHDSKSVVRFNRLDRGQYTGGMSYPDYLDFNAKARQFTGVIAERLVPLSLNSDQPQRVNGSIVSGNFFAMLGVNAALGRTFTPDDNRVEDGHPVTVIGHHFWQRSLGADPNILGRKLVFNGHPFEVIGVAAPGFTGVEFGSGTDVWLPLAMVKVAMPRNAQSQFLQQRRAGWLTCYGRLASTATIDSAQAEVEQIATALERENPDSNRNRRFQLTANPGMHPNRRGSVAQLMSLLMAGVGVLLLIACGNVAILLLARARHRVQEMTIRRALGAGRGRLVRQLLAESLLMATLATAAGLAAAPWILSAIRSLLAFSPGMLRVATPLDGRVLLFCAIVAVFTTLIFGLLPALSTARSGAGNSLRTTASRGVTARSSADRIWVVAQMALTLMLLLASGLVLRSVRNILDIDPGYDRQHVLMAEIDISLEGYTPERGRRFIREAITQLESEPGVRSATFAKSSPAIDWSDRSRVFRAGEYTTPAQVDRDPSAGLTTDVNLVAPGYFKTLSIPLITGRDFTTADNDQSPRVAIVSEKLAQALWPGRDPVGLKLVQHVGGRYAQETFQVIGVVRDVRYRTVVDEARPLMYVPVLQIYDAILKPMIAVDGDPRAFRSQMEAALHRVDPRLPIPAISSISDQVHRQVGDRRVIGVLTAVFGGLALLLAASGLYALLSFLVARRTREFGIRMALGATAENVLKGVFASGFKLVAAGAVLGAVLAWWGAQFLESQLYGVGTGDLLTAAVAIAALAAVAALACWLPAHRATRIDPAVALRDE